MQAIYQAEYIYTESVLFKVGMGGITTFFFMASYMTISVFYFGLSKNNQAEDS
jgi:hypothetical protein